MTESQRIPYSLAAPVVSYNHVTLSANQISDWLDGVDNTAFDC